MKAPWLKEKGDRHVCVVRARRRRSGMDDPVRFDRLVGPTVWGDDRSPAVAGPRVGGIGAARVHGIRRPGPVPHTYTPQGTAVAVLPSIDVDSRTAVVVRRVLGIVVSAGARFWHVRGVLAADPTTNARSIGRSHDDAVRSRQQITRAGIARAGPTRRLTRARSRAAPDAVSL
jgi:hypothetical protein